MSDPLPALAGVVSLRIMKCGEHIKQGHIKRIDSLDSCIIPTAYNRQRLDERYGGLYEEDYVY